MKALSINNFTVQRRLNWQCLFAAITFLLLSIAVWNLVGAEDVNSLYRSSGRLVRDMNTIPEAKFNLWYNYLSKRGVRFEIGTEKAYKILSEKNAQGLFTRTLIDIDTNTFDRVIVSAQLTPSSF